MVKTVSGVDFRNSPVQVATAGKKATVLMVYSPTCPYCEKNWPNWASLISRVPDQNVDFVVVDLTATATPEFIAKKNTGRAILIHKLLPQDFVALYVNLTPQTILIGKDSRVEKVWTGPLSAEDMSKLYKMLL